MQWPSLASTLKLWGGDVAQPGVDPGPNHNCKVWLDAELITSRSNSFSRTTRRLSTPLHHKDSLKDSGRSSFDKLQLMAMLGLACTAFTAILAPVIVHAAANPGILELDLIFPRNGSTYAPVPLMPVVFAVQNPTLALPLDLLIWWSVDRNGSNGTLGPPAYDNNEINLQYLNASSLTDPHLAIAYIPTLSGHEDTWIFTWELSSANCSQVSPPNAGGLSYSVHQPKFITFNTNNSAQAPDLQAATSPDTCGMTEGFTFNVTGIEQLTLPQSNAQPSCGVLGPTPTTKNPCAVTIDASAASSISSALSLSACEKTSFSCTPTPSSAASQFEPSAFWWLATLGLMLDWAS